MALRRPDTGAGTQDRALAAGYFLLQAFVGVALWLLYASSARARHWFGLVGSHPRVTESFFLPDVAVVIASLLTAGAIRAGRRTAAPLAAFTAGGLLYPTLYLIQFTMLSGDGKLVLLLMLPPTVVSGSLAVALAFDPPS